MFFTLKHNRLTDESSFETTAAPFTKKREGRLAKIACTNCRMSKLKCSGELRGCQRCRCKKLECQYPRISKQKAQSSLSPSPPDPPQARTPPPPAATGTNVENDFMAAAAFTQKPEPAFSSSFQDLGPGVDVSDFTMSDNTAACTLLSDEEYMEISNTLIQCQQEPFSSTVNINASNSPWDSMLQMENKDFNNTSNNTTPPTLSPPATMESICSCFVQAIGTHEAIEVAVWSQRESFSDMQDILRHHKQVLVECERLLDCKKCSKNPGFVMLLISMVRKIFDSLRELYHGAGSQRAVSEMATIAESGTELRGVENSGNQCKNGDETRRLCCGISLQGQQLDDDDEHLVLQSLLKARVAKLEHLLSLLHKVVVEQSWPAHKSLVRCLQNRLSGRWIIE